VRTIEKKLFWWFYRLRLFFHELPPTTENGSGLAPHLFV
jgi:hypothetical protein